ncbi:MAG: DNA primase, partial [Chloroflexi bacterium]
MSVAQEIKARLDIVEYIQQYVPLKKSGRHYKACCPFHSEKTPSFIVNTETQSWRCFGACSEGGDIFNFAMKLHSWDFRQALEELGRLAGVEVRKQTPQQREEIQYEERLRDILRTAAEAFHSALLQDAPDSQAALQYAVERRGFSLETIEKYQIGFAVDSWDNLLIHLREIGYKDDDIIDAGLAIRNDKGRIYDRFRNRLIIPIRDERGRVVGFGARALGDEHPKYLNSPQTPVFDKSRLLFGLDMARESIRQSGIAIIVEGYMDVIQAHQAGYMNVVAQMGTALTEPQLKLIAPRHAQRIILALDADEAGQNAMRRSLEVARQVLQDDYAGRLSVDIRILQIPGAKDPDDFLRATPEQWPQIVETALPIADFIINLETEKLPPDASIQERERAARAILPLLYASEDNLYRKANIQKLAMRLRIQEADLLAWAEEQ